MFFKWIKNYEKKKVWQQKFFFRFGVGPYEEKGYKKTESSSYEKKSLDQTKRSSKTVLNIVYKALEVYKNLIDKIKALGGKHPTCPHPNSCIHYILGVRNIDINFLCSYEKSTLKN